MTTNRPVFCKCGAQWYADAKHSATGISYTDLHRDGGKGHGLISHDAFIAQGNVCYCSKCKSARIKARIASVR